MNLEKLVGSLPPKPVGTVTIDLSELLEMPEKSVVWDFKDPSLPSIFSIPGIAEHIKIQFPEWPQELQHTIALMAVCYVPSPDEKQHSWLLMAHLAERLDMRFIGIIKRFEAAFPHLKDLNAEAESAKK